MRTALPCLGPAVTRPLHLGSCAATAPPPPAARHSTLYSSNPLSLRSLLLTDHPAGYARRFTRRLPGAGACDS